VRILNPTAGETLAVGDQLLTLGTSEQIRHFKEWLRESAEAPAAPGK
jgi:K+/H+ antiporter YhaU regulatory subunit KhtT